MGVPRGPDDPTGPVSPVIVEAETSEPNYGSSDQSDTDISKKEFRYNPPIHNANLHARVDFGYDSKYTGSRVRVADLYDEDDAPRNYTEKWAGKNLNDLRLGRIIQHNLAPGHTANMKYRWGFRFLYNPSSLTFAASRNNSFVIDGRSETNRVLSGVNQNFQTISMEILLDRVPDVMATEIRKDDYSPTLRKNDADGLRRFGTHWDLEALFKVCNGEWNLTDRGKTSNIGVLIPSNARLIIGKGDNLYGFVHSVSYQDVLFSKDMVPMRTQVSLTFRRHVDMSPNQIEKSFPGLGTIGTGEESGALSSDIDQATIGNDKNAPLPGHNTVKTGFYGYANHNGWDYPAPAGTAIYATHSGTVERIRSLTTSYGKHVYITNGRITMIYAHMSAFNPNLRVGQVISAGTWLGRVGSTGNSSGNHLHYEERVDGKPRIPIFATNVGKVR